MRPQDFDPRSRKDAHALFAQMDAEDRHYFAHTAVEMITFHEKLRTEDLYRFLLGEEQHVSPEKLQGIKDHFQWTQDNFGVPVHELEPMLAEVLEEERLRFNKDPQSGLMHDSKTERLLSPHEATFLQLEELKARFHGGDTDELEVPDRVPSDWKP